MKKSLIALVGGVILMGSLSPAGAIDLPDEQWSIMTNLFDKSADRTGDSLLGLSIQDATDLSEKVSELIGRDSAFPNELGLRLCTSTSDPYCAKPKADWLQAFLPVCTSNSEVNCIEAVTALKDGVEIQGEYRKNFPAKGFTDFPADPSRNVPQGSTPSLWNFPGLIHGGGTSEYLTSFMVQGGFVNGDSFSFGSYFATINPVTIQAGAWARNEARDGRNKTMPSCEGHCGLELLGHSSNDKFVCAALEDGFCALRQAFPSNVRFRIIARLSQSPAGWFHGRIKSPDIKLTPISNGIRISVEAEPVSVPVVGVLQKNSELSAAVKKDIAGTGGFTWGEPGPDGLRNVLRMPSPDSQQAFDAFLQWKDYIKDRANASPTEWAVRTLADSGNMGYCMGQTKELVGVVSTNSMIYLGSPPIFNKETQSLEYKVASPHFDSKGGVFKGTYDLVLKSEVARCLYGFSNAPISATISIINDSGDTNIATTTVNESDGWLRLAAYGFTFSNPTLLVKLTQEKAPVDTPIKSKPVVTKKTITCQKGKIVKKVTSTKPTCPAGYKKS